MSSQLSCLPNINCIPFEDPSDREEDKCLTVFSARAQAEKARDLKPTEWEASAPILKRFLKTHNFDIEPATASWKEWVKWRHGIGGRVP